MMSHVHICTLVQNYMITHQCTHYDVTLTGHVIYELSTGRELGVEFPGEGDYEMVKGKEQIIQILTFIFNTSTKVDNRSVSYQEGLKDVRHMHVTCMSHVQ